MMKKNERLSPEETERLTKEVWHQRYILEITRISDDIDGKKKLSEAEYRELLQEMLSRLGDGAFKDLCFALPSGIHGFQGFFQNVTIPGADIASTLASFLSNMLSMLSYRRLDRKLSWGERIIVVLCLLAILLSITSFVFGLHLFIAIGLATTSIVIASLSVASAIISWAKTLKTISVMKDELHRTEQLAQYSKTEVLRLLAEKEAAEQSKQVFNSDLLRAALDQYTQNGYMIHRLRCELQTPRMRIMHGAYALMGLIGVVGAVFLFFPPLLPIIGAGLMGFAAVFSAGMAMANWLHHRLETRHLSPKDADDLRHQRREAKTPNEIHYVELLKASHMGLWANHASAQKGGEKRPPFPEAVVQKSPIHSPPQPKPSGEAKTEKDPLNPH